MKTQTRKIAEKIQDKTGRSLIWINFQAQQLVGMGLCLNHIQALNYLLEIA